MEVSNCFPKSRFSKCLCYDLTSSLFSQAFSRKIKNNAALVFYVQILNSGCVFFLPFCRCFEAVSSFPLPSLSLQILKKSFQEKSSCFFCFPVLFSLQLILLYCWKRFRRPTAKRKKDRKQAKHGILICRVGQK